MGEMCVCVRVIPEENKTKKNVSELGQHRMVHHHHKISIRYRDFSLVILQNSWREDDLVECKSTGKSSISNVLSFYLQNKINSCFMQRRKVEGLSPRKT